MESNLVQLISIIALFGCLLGSTSTFGAEEKVPKLKGVALKNAKHEKNGKDLPGL